MGLLLTVVSVLLRLLFSGGGDPVEAVVVGMIYAAVPTVVFAVRQRADERAFGRGAHRLPGLDRRMQKEDIPEDPEERRLMALSVQRRQNQLRSAGRWAFLVIGVCIALLAVLFFLLAGVMGGLVVIAVSAALIVVVLWNRRRLFARYARLTDRLGEEDGADGRSGMSGWPGASGQSGTSGWSA